jgi:hypothetical protein
VLSVEQLPMATARYEISAPSRLPVAPSATLEVVDNHFSSLWQLLWMFGWLLPVSFTITWHVLRSEARQRSGEHAA